MSERAIERAPAQRAAVRAPGINTDGIGLFDLCEALAKSGYFKDARDASQALVKVLAGQEMGFGPLASMSGIHIIEGKPVLSSNLLAAAIKRSGIYDYRVVQHTDAVAEVAFLEGGQEVGRVTWTAADAQRAGLTGKDNWKRYPRAMLFARAIAEGARTYCPGVFGGIAPYSDEELEATAAPAPAGVIDVRGRVATAMETAPSFAETKGLSAPAASASEQPIGEIVKAEWDARYPDAAKGAFGDYAARVLGRALRTGKQREEDYAAVVLDLRNQEAARKRAFGVWDTHAKALALETADAAQRVEMLQILELILEREVTTRSTLTAGEWDRLSAWLVERAQSGGTEAPADPFEGEA